MEGVNSSPVLPQPTRFERFKQNTWPKIKGVAIKIFKALVAVALYVANPSIFAVGYLIGIIWDKEIDATIDKIVNIVKNNKIFVVVGLGAFAILSLPVTLAAASLIYGGYVGSQLSLSSKPKEVEAVKC